MGRLDGKIIIVTGSSSGYGRAIAKACSMEGAIIVCSDIRREARREGYEKDIDIPTDEVIQQSNGECIFVKCDVTQENEVKSLVQTAVEMYGRIDVMINNAGVFTRLARCHECTEEEYDFTMAVNSKGVWNGCKQAITQMLKQGNGGKIINTVSTAGLVATPEEPAYDASKGASANLTRNLAIDYGRDNITVNAICPNWGPTALSRAYYDDPKVREEVEKITPLGRWVLPEEVAKLAVFLASDDSNYISGALIPIDGGYTSQ